MARMDNNFDVQSYLASQRSLERARETGRTVDNMTATIRKMDILLTAMWGLVQEIGITQEELNNRIDKIVNGNESLLAGRGNGTCPKCKKKVTESPKTPFRGQCLYCGSPVSFYPEFDVDEDDANSDEEIEGEMVAGYNPDAKDPDNMFSSYDPGVSSPSSGVPSDPLGIIDPFNPGE